MDIAAKVCNCCGVDAEAVMKAFCKPRIKVGTEWVTKGQNIVQSMNAVGGIARYNILYISYTYIMFIIYIYYIYIFRPPQGNL